MHGVIMQNIFLNIQRHDVLATPVSFTCTMSSFNDFDCMKTIADIKLLRQEFHEVIDIFLSPNCCLL